MGERHNNSNRGRIDPLYSTPNAFVGAGYIPPPHCHPDRGPIGAERRDPFDSACGLAQDKPMGSRQKRADSDLTDPSTRFRIRLWASP